MTSYKDDVILKPHKTIDNCSLNFILFIYFPQCTFSFIKENS